MISNGLNCPVLVILEDAYICWGRLHRLSRFDVRIFREEIFIGDLQGTKSCSEITL
jgi:hypothetical protein